MKLVLTHTNRLHVAALALGVASVVGLAALASVVPEGAGAGLRAAFAPLCHQMPERSFGGAGGAWALCHRCTGVLAGLALGLTGALAGRCPPVGPALAVAVAPAVAHWALEAFLGVPTSAFGRVGTGVWAGVGLGLVAASAFGGAPGERRFRAAP